MTDDGWIYGGNPAGDHYSQLGQINSQNVGRLTEAWRFDAGQGGLQTSPLVANGKLFAATPDQAVLALDPATGRELWRFNPDDPALQPVRGFAYWQGDGRRVLFASHGSSLTALNADDGQPVATFGTHGSIDLRDGLDRDPTSAAVFLTTPGVVYKDLLIVGFRTYEAHPAPPGTIRAYDVRTGKLRWRFRTIPDEGEAGAETWPAAGRDHRGGANNWAGMALDAKRGIVFVPTGSAVDDMYGGDRVGANLYANSLIALDASTGKRLWHFQIVHHDIWDRDLPSPPVLLKVQRDGRQVDAVAQGTKQGFIFLFERATGKPLFPIEERPMPPSSVPGEKAWPTQPFPISPAPVARQKLTADMLTTRTPQAAAAARAEFAKFVSNGPYMPFSLGKQTIIFPGFDGGMEWGGPAVDPRRGILYVNSSDVAWTGGLAPIGEDRPDQRGQQLYRQNCSACHGLERQGSPPEFPSLIEVFKRKSEFEIVKTILRGRGRMPGFPQLGGPELGALMGYLASPSPGTKRQASPPPSSRASKAAYSFTGYKKFLDPDGYPAVAPPWGTLSAIDMNSGRFLWKVPLGEYPELVAAGMPPTGSENYGGPILTAGGVLFIGATIYDRKFRAFDPATGRLLWDAQLPFAGVATPITYMVGGRQFVVIATSGQRDPKGPQGSAYVAFALPSPGGR